MRKNKNMCEACKLIFNYKLLAAISEDRTGVTWCYKICPCSSDIQALTREVTFLLSVIIKYIYADNLSLLFITWVSLWAKNYSGK